MLLVLPKKLAVRDFGKLYIATEQHSSLSFSAMVSLVCGDDVVEFAQNREQLNKEEKIDRNEY